MKRLLIAGLLGLSLSLFASVALAGASGNVVGSYIFTDNGQGGWVGGPLFADGTAGGGGAFSAANGQDIISFQATTWAFIDQAHVDVCYVILSSKNDAPVGSTFCLSDFWLGGIPVTGTPIKVVNPFEPDQTTLIRVTLNQ